MEGTTIFSDFLRGLGVPHTGDYSDGRFLTMPFKSLFGFSRLLTEYGVDNRGVEFSDKSVLKNIPTPFLAHVGSAFVIVDHVDDSTVGYTLYHRKASRPTADFIKAWDGVALLAYPSERSREPDLRKHLGALAVKRAKLYLLLACALSVAVFGFIKAGLWESLSTIFLTLTDMAGIYICWLLMLKSVKVKSHTADRVTAILEKHGCDTVLEQKASTFFGLFGWSEVGMAYFTVTTLVMFLFPEMTHWLALINGCCLPFTVWSISYQKFVIKTWCTLCVTVQTLLWLQFFCYLSGGWWHGVFPLRLSFFVMIAAYVAVMLGLNRIVEHLKR